jgi:hypothetical protein
MVSMEDVVHTVRSTLSASQDLLVVVVVQEVV